jgi:plastin-1
MMGLISQFRNIDVEEKGSIDKQTVIKAMQDSGEANYDQVRETLKEVSIDSSGKVELEDYVEVRYTIISQGY